MAKPIKRPVTPAAHYERVLRALKDRFAMEAQRSRETRRLVSFPYVRGDLHMHTRYSDGWGEVADMVEVANARGLDFIFVTDHFTVRQKLECRRYKNVWWGQEPVSGQHHICILDVQKKFAPTGEMKRDANSLRGMGLFFFYPHPTGWYPNVHYTAAQSQSLTQVGPAFAMEIINSIFRIEPFHDSWTAGNVALWDGFLCRGYRVTGLAATDSHFPFGVGNAWTGVLRKRPSKRGVLEMLTVGDVFASTGPAINLTCHGTAMGGARPASKGRAEVTLEAADAAGLAWARVISQGKIAAEYDLRGKVHCRERVVLGRGKTGYVRAECAAIDDRRAYANPIYFA